MYVSIEYGETVTVTLEEHSLSTFMVVNEGEESKIFPGVKQIKNPNYACRRCGNELRMRIGQKAEECYCGIEYLVTASSVTVRDVSIG